MDALTFYKLAKGFKHIQRLCRNWCKSAHEKQATGTAYLWLGTPFNGAGIRLMQKWRKDKDTN